MSFGSYIDTAPLFEITKYHGGPPQDAVSFVGYPRQHPYEVEKIILVNEPLGAAPRIMEFKLSDIVYIEEQAAQVNESGESFPLMKIWVKRGAFGVIHEPFEVQDPIKLMRDSKELHERIMRSFK